MSIASAVFGTKKRIVFACTTIFCSTILFSAFSTPTHAEEMGASIEIPPSLTLSVPASVSMNVTPGVKDFDSKSCNIVVGTNSIAGYTLTTSATSTNLTNTTDSTKTISTLPSSSEGYTESNFVANKWGYKIGNGNYKPYVSEATLADTHEQTAGDTTALTFATKVDLDQPTGTYNLTVNFSAVAKVYVPPYMQDFTVAEANAMDEGETKNLIDSRDNQSYTVAKLPDGNVWMTKNLDLAGGTTLTPSDSNVSSNYTLPASSTSGFSDDSTAYVYNSGSTTCGDGSPCYSYYSYVAATAGTNPSTDGESATSDICPKGWRLPTKAEYETLASTYTTGATLTAAPFLGVYGGLYDNSSFSYGGSLGDYWSSTALVFDDGRADDAYIFLFGSSYVRVTFDYRRGGYSVRCVKDIPTMQDFTTSEAAAMATGETKTLRDSRDGQDYTVTKLPDGNVWMTQNLRFTGTSIDSSTTNINTTKTLSYGDLTSGNSYTEPMIHDSGDATTGVWYNYCAATAGTICTEYDYEEASFSLCPAGWKLPTSSEQQGITGYASSFSPLTGGFYNSSGSLSNTMEGYWWSSTVPSVGDLLYNGSRRRMLSYSSYNGLGTNGSWNMNYGVYVRCVLKTTMQDFTVRDANNMSIGDTKPLRDSRDNQVYTVAKLADGNVWMTKNLDLAGGTTLTPATSNVSSNYTLPASSTSGFSDDSTAYVYNSGSTTCGNGSPCYSYYSYVAATAGTNPSSGNATSDICPKGWRLPTEAEFNTLKSSYTTGAALTASPFLAVYAGLYDDSSFDSGGSYGYYWSSTASNSNNAYSLPFYSSNAFGRNYLKRFGFSVRCVLDARTIADATNLQDVTSGMAANTVIGATATLKDTRDNQTYTVAKLADDNVWMIDNLNLGATTLSTDLTSSNTNLSTTISASTFNSYKKTSGTATYTAAEYIPVSGTDSTSGTAYGTLYNYCAASAGTICTDSNSGNATYDICPKGWRLPRDYDRNTRDQGEFMSLRKYYNAYAEIRAPVSQGGAAFALAGYFTSSTPTRQGSDGYYWSSTVGSSPAMYGLMLSGSYWTYANINYRSSGYSIRCILK